MKTTMEIQQDLLQKLSPHRYEHTLGVAYTAACLAMRYGVDIQKAWLAGLLHDCAKFHSPDILLAECEARSIAISEAERLAPHLLHAKLGAAYALECYEVEDDTILSAIRLHTTGKPAMTLLEQILFVADYMEPGRKAIPGLAEVRESAFVDLDITTTKILENTLSYLENQGTVIDPLTVETLEYYKEKIDP